MPAKSRLSAASPYFLSVLRIVAGLLFICHGLQKIFGIFGFTRVPIWSIFGAAGLIELIGGALIILGLFTRPTAFVLCGEMAVAYFRAHAPKAPFPVQNGGELAVLFCFLFFYMIFAGGGAISLDALFRNGE
ncbi:MAG TPA: DoxX family protein [Bryobacteraceae bacterium]|jgi:putative oxidoreductase|nr:DoxX family protein [Bryobacteraceae bacterium]